MITIKKTGEGYYLATPAADVLKLDRNECYSIKKSLVEIIKPHRDITLDIKHIKSIDNPGFKILEELKLFSTSKRCNLRFINVQEGLMKKISELVKIKPIELNEYN